MKTITDYVHILSTLGRSADEQSANKGHQSNTALECHHACEAKGYVIAGSPKPLTVSMHLVSAELGA
jgi:hypothetical protein